MKYCKDCAWFVTTDKFMRPGEMIIMGGWHTKYFCRNKECRFDTNNELPENATACPLFTPKED